MKRILLLGAVLGALIPGAAFAHGGEHLSCKAMGLAFATYSQTAPGATGLYVSGSARNYSGLWSAPGVGDEVAGLDHPKYCDPTP